MIRCWRLMRHKLGMKAEQELCSLKPKRRLSAYRMTLGRLSRDKGTTQSPAVAENVFPSSKKYPRVWRRRKPAGGSGDTASNQPPEGGQETGRCSTIRAATPQRQESPNKALWKWIQNCICFLQMKSFRWKPVHPHATNVILLKEIVTTLFYK